MPDSRLFDDQIRQHHLRLSKSAVAFLDYIERTPACLRRAEFEALLSCQPFATTPWPVIVSRRVTAELGELTGGILAMMARLPHIEFAFDLPAMQRYFGGDEHGLRHVLAILGGARPPVLIGRSDCIDDVDRGFQCVEMNAQGALGGIECSIAARLLPSLPVLAPFFDEHEPLLRVTSPHRMLLRLALGEHRHRVASDPCNIALLWNPAESVDQGLAASREPLIAHAQAELVSLAEEAGLQAGQLAWTDPADLRLDENLIMSGTMPVHALYEAAIINDDALDDLMTTATLADTATVCGGPLRRFLSDKRLLALLSERADRGDLAEVGDSSLARFIPWTRTVAPGDVLVDGQRAPLLHLLDSSRERWIMKPARGYGGGGIVVGESVSPSAWQAAIRTALNGQWVVQEKLTPRPMVRQTGLEGFTNAIAVWSAFTGAAHYGGAFVRSAPATGEVVVNVERGAEFAFLLEEEETV